LTRPRPDQKRDTSPTTEAAFFDSLAAATASTTAARASPFSPSSLMIRPAMLVPSPDRKPMMATATSSSGNSDTKAWKVTAAARLLPCRSE
jgi:hypothetical protein